jgi:hypothetical protein
MLTLYNPPSKSGSAMEYIQQEQNLYGRDVSLNLSEHIELIDMSIQRFSISNSSRRPPAQLVNHVVTFFQQGKVVHRRYLFHFYAAGYDHKYSMTLIKPKGADRLSVVSQVWTHVRVESRLLLKE